MSEPSADLSFSVKKAKGGYIITDADGNVSVASDVQGIAHAMAELLGVYVDIPPDAEEPPIVRSLPQAMPDGAVVQVPITPMHLTPAQMKAMGVRPVDRSNLPFKGPSRHGNFKHPKCGHVSTRYESGHCTVCKMQFCSVCHVCNCS